MTVNDFIQEYNGDIDKLNIRKYVPVAEKAETINTVLESVIISENRIVTTYNSISMEIVCIMAGISLFTDLETSTCEDYDQLIETGLLDDVISSIGPDFNRYMSLFEMRKSDYLREKNSIDDVLGRISNVVMNTLKEVDPNIITELLELLEK